MSSIAEVRQDFLRHPYVIPNVKRDFIDWHKGRKRYALWAVQIDTPEVCAQVLAAQHYLQPFLLADYCRQPHITLGICGFPSVFSYHEDDYTQEAFDTDIACLRAHEFLPFEVEINTLNSFASAPFLHVHDQNGALLELHRGLNRWSNAVHAAYVPHVTVGLYARQWPTCRLTALLDRNDHHQGSTRCVVSRVSLMTYLAAEIGGGLTVVADYDFLTKQVVWHTSESIFV